MVCLWVLAFRSKSNMAVPSFDDLENGTLKNVVEMSLQLVNSRALLARDEHNLKVLWQQ